MGKVGFVFGLTTFQIWLLWLVSTKAVYYVVYLCLPSCLVVQWISVGVKLLIRQEFTLAYLVG